MKNLKLILGLEKFAEFYLNRGFIIEIKDETKNKIS